MKVSGKYGLSTRGPCFDQVLVQNRQNPVLARILAVLLCTPLSDLIVSHDRWSIFSRILSSNCSAIMERFEKHIESITMMFWWQHSAQIHHLQSHCADIDGLRGGSIEFPNWWVLLITLRTLIIFGHYAPCFLQYRLPLQGSTPTPVNRIFQLQYACRIVANHTSIIITSNI